MIRCYTSGLWHVCVSVFSTGFNVGIFSVTQRVGVTQLVFVFLSKGIDLHVAVYSVHLWD